MRRRTILLATAASVLTSQLAYAGAWTRPKDSWQLIGTANIYKASHYFDTQGKKRKQLPFYKQELYGYAEYGWREDITLGGQLTLARAFQTSTGEQSNWNLGDSELFVRKRVWQDEANVFSVQPGVIMPSLDGQSRPKVGSDHPSLTVRTSYGRNFKLFGKDHYADTGVVYVHRLGAPSDQIKLEATAGINITDKWQVIPQLFITKATGGVQNSAFTQSSADNYDLTKLQLSVQYAMERKSAVQLGAYLNAAGRNTGNGQGVLLSYVKEF